MPDKRAFFVPRTSEKGRHQSFDQAFEGEYAFRKYLGGSDPQSRLNAYNAATAELQGIIGECLQRGTTLRARGSLWSLSRAAVTDGRLIDTKLLRIAFNFPADQVDANYAGDSDKLRFIECGASIDSISRYLFRDGLSLKASGSNNGQTLAGALSTGTHGGAFNVGALPEMVAGLHLVVGPNKHVYLERASHPVMKPGFAQALGAEFIQDDTLFNAALVSFGSFGIIHGIMIEARELFVLNALRFNHPYNAALKTAINTLDLGGLQLPAEAANIPKDKPYHFEVFYNPNEGAPPDEAIVILMYEGPWDASYEAPEWDADDPGMGASGLEVMGSLLDLIPSPLNKLVVPMLNDQVADKFEPYVKTGIIRDLFRGEVTLGKTMACGIGLPLDRAEEALNIAFKIYEDSGDVLPILLSHRFVKGTDALLGFTRFDTTAVLEIDSINMDSTQDYLRQVWEGLYAVGIPFTLHWGKFNSFLNAARVRDRYGNAAVDQWISARETLLESAEVRQVFTNPFIRQLGLAT